METIISMIIGYIFSMTAFFHFEYADYKSGYRLSFWNYIFYLLIHTFIALVIVYFLFGKG